MITSAAILLYRRRQDRLQVWIGHMGGPFWARKDTHAWSIPKGEYLPEEDPLTAALREFSEEMGTPAPAAEYELLGSFRQSAKKAITVFTAETDFYPERIASNTFALEWPKGSGRIREYPEIDDAGWFSPAAARTKLVKGQVQVLDALLQRLVEQEP
ncbi:NUDIX domain-containing protein [Arthrobacter sp. zg-Y411]|uniref:NUDIX domain-containing protein n=1 Tax=Arthrobacter zhangbolii TaxID=2886936 RepID=UPI001D13EEBF|nr:NUDIX domain-containing protein [Arthrobacter zhangbolii]MCC3293588.1 NUDIX domain-containing protein [Arthrobacter zhangbolii]